MRAGASAELIAAETGWPLDRVQRYAEPPLAERAYIAERAQQVEMRRSGGRVRLTDSVDLVIGADHARQVVWDAHRRDDGRWIVTATLPSGSGRASATWSYDPAGPNLHPLDEPARWLMGVSDEPIIDFIIDTPAEPDMPEEPVRPHLIAVPSIVDETTDEMVDEIVDDGAGDLVIDSGDEASDGHGTGAPSTAQAASTADPETGQTSLPVGTPESGKSRKARPKGRRASVPSWDEILFGATRGDDA